MSGYWRQETELSRVGSHNFPNYRSHQAVRGIGTRDMGSADIEENLFGGINTSSPLLMFLSLCWEFE